MKEVIISFETAKLAKKNGLPQVNGEYYTENGEFYSFRDHWNHKEPLYYAPTQSLLQKWLREEQNINLMCVHCPLSNKWLWELYTIDPKEEADEDSDCSFPNYEEALEDALIYALNSIKLKQ